MTNHADLSSDSIVVRIADIKTGQNPSVITTVLGSCVAVCLYDPVQEIGGMLHCMLPQAPEGKTDFNKAKFADTGVKELLAQLIRYPLVKKELITAKIFGGGHVLKHVTLDIGGDNVEAVRQVLARLEIRVLAVKTGGNQGCSIAFDLATGRVKYQAFGQPVLEV
ncbi:MAG: chemotaxis protein CheD [Candidatus Omnitrophota bacterium]